MATLRALRRAFGLAPDGLTIPVDGVNVTLTAYGFNRSSVAPPCHMPAEVDIARGGDRRTTFGGQVGIEAVSYVLTSSADDQRGQELLDALIIPVALAIETDATLRAALNAAPFVHNVDGYRLYTVGDKQYFGARFRVSMMATLDAEES